jgi:hypothetical protein
MPNYNKQIEVSCPNCGIKRLARGDVVRKALKERDEFWCLPCRNRTKVHLPRKYVGTKQERNRQATKAWRESNPNKVLDKRYKERYGVTFVEYQLMLKAQNHKCAICGVNEKESRQGKLVVDHNHATKAIRGLLCHNCNCGLGHFNDNIDKLQNAIKYIQG